MAFNINAQIILSQPKNLNNVTKQISKKLGKVTKIDLKIGNVAQLTTLNKQLTVLNNSLSKLNSGLSSTRGSVSSLGKSFNNTASGVNNAAKAQGTLNNQVTRANQALKNQAGLVGALGKRFGSVAKQAIAFGIISRPIYDLQRAFTGAVKDAVAFEKEIVRISQVTGKSVQQLQGLTEQVNKLATSLGISANELAETSRVIAQAGIRGKDLEQVLTALARSTLAPTFGKITDTTEGLIAAFGQFGLKGKDAEAVLGSLNKVSKEFAVEAEDLISVIRRAGGVFSQAAGDSKGTVTALQELSAVFTAVRSSTRESADTIAAGLRTIFSRIQRRTTINFLKQFGVDLTDAQGKFVGIFPAFDQLSTKLDDIIKKGDALTLSAIAEELGGIRQIGKLLPAIAQFDKARKALTEAQKGAVEGLGADVSKSLDTIDNRVKRVRETFNQLIRTVFESDSFQNFSKNILASAESFLKFGNDIVEALEPVLPILSTLGAFKLGRGLGSLLGGGIGGAITSATGSTAGAQAAQKTAAAVTSQIQLTTNTNSILTRMSNQLSNIFQVNNSGFNQIAKAIATRPTGGIAGVGGRRRAGGGFIPKFADGGRVYGPSHAAGGVIAELEGGEYVVPKKYASGGTIADNLGSAENRRRVVRGAKNLKGLLGDKDVQLNAQDTFQGKVDRKKYASIIPSGFAGAGKQLKPKVFEEYVANQNNTVLSKKQNAPLDIVAKKIIEVKRTQAQVGDDAIRDKLVRAITAGDVSNKSKLTGDINKLRLPTVEVAEPSRRPLTQKSAAKLRDQGYLRRKTKVAGGIIQKLATGDIVRANSVGVAILDPDDVADGKAKVSVKDIENQIGFTAGTKRGFSGVGKVFKGKNYSIVKQGLNQKTSERFNKALAEGLIKGVDFAASELSGDLGLGPTTIDQASKTKFIQSQRSALRGDLFEAVLSSLDNRGKFDDIVDFARPFDFPEGLKGPFADNFSRLPSKFVDAKSSKEAAPDSNIRGKIIREIAADVVKTDPNILAQKNNQTGGKASKKSAKQPRGFGALTFAGGGEVPVRISDGEMVVTDPREVAARKGELQRINKLSAGGFASGTIARGPGTGTSDSIYTTLPEGAFVVNAASTKKYLGLRKGGGVGAFRRGGTTMAGLERQRAIFAMNLERAKASGNSAAVTKLESRLKDINRALDKAAKNANKKASADAKAAAASNKAAQADLQEANASNQGSGLAKAGQNLLGVTLALQTLTSTVSDADSAAAGLVQSISNTILTLSLLGSVIPVGKIAEAIGAQGKFTGVLPQFAGASGRSAAAGGLGVVGAGIVGGFAGRSIGESVADALFGKRQEVAGIRGDVSSGTSQARGAFSFGGAVVGGAAGGAAIGSFVPVIGTAIGAAIGAGAGAIVGAITQPLDIAVTQASFRVAKSIEARGNLLDDSLKKLEKDFTGINFGKVISDFDSQLDLAANSFDTIVKGFAGERSLFGELTTFSSVKIKQDINKALDSLSQLIPPEKVARISAQLDKGLLEFVNSLDIENLQGPESLDEALLNAAESGNKFARDILNATDTIIRGRVTSALSEESVTARLADIFRNPSLQAFDAGQGTFNQLVAGSQAIGQVALGEAARTGVNVTDVEFSDKEVADILKSQGITAKSLGVSQKQFDILVKMLNVQYNQLIEEQEKLIDEQKQAVLQQAQLNAAISSIKKEVESLVLVFRNATNNLNFSLDRASITLTEFASNISNIFSGSGIANLGQITNPFDVNNPQGEAAQENFFRRLGQIPGIGEQQLDSFRDFQRLRSEGINIIKDVISEGNARGSTGDELLAALDARFASLGLQLPEGVRNVLEEGLKREGGDGVIPADVLEKLFKSGQLQEAFGQIFQEAAAASDNFVEAYNRAIKITEQRTQIEAQLLQEQVKFRQAVTDSIIAQEKRTKQILAGNLGTGVGDGISAAERNVRLRAEAQAGSADSGDLLARRQAALDRQFQLQQGVREGTIDPFSDAFVNESAQLQTEINNTTKALEGLANESEVFQAILEKSAKIGQNINALETGLDDLIGKVASGDARGVLQIAQQQSAIGAAFSGTANIPQALTALTALQNEGNQALVDVAAGQEGAGKELRRLLLRQLGGRLAAGGGIAGQSANRFLQAIAFSEEKKDQLAKIAEARAARQRQIREELLKQNQNQTQLLRKFLELGFAKTFEESVKEFTTAVDKFAGQPSDIDDVPLIPGQTFSPLTRDRTDETYIPGAPMPSVADEGFFGGVFEQIWGGTPEEITEEWKSTNNRIQEILEGGLTQLPGEEGEAARREFQKLVNRRDTLKPVIEQLAVNSTTTNKKLQELIDQLKQTIQDETRARDSQFERWLGGLQFAGPAQGNTGGSVAVNGIYAQRGMMVPFEPKGTDTVPAMLTPGEFVIKKSSVDQYGPGVMQAVNQGNAQIFAARGGRVGKGVLYREDGGGSDNKFLDAVEKRLNIDDVQRAAEATVDFARRAGLGFKEETLEGIINEVQNPLGGVRSAQGALGDTAFGSTSIFDNPLMRTLIDKALSEGTTGRLQDAGVLPGRKKYQAIYQPVDVLAEKDLTVSNPNDITTFNIDDARYYEKILQDPVAYAEKLYGKAHLEAAKEERSVGFTSRARRPGENKLFPSANPGDAFDLANQAITLVQSIALESPLVQELTDKPVGIYENRYDEIIASVEKYAAGKLGFRGADDPRIVEALQEARNNNTTFEAISKQFLETKGRLDESAEQYVKGVLGDQADLNKLAGQPGVGNRTEFIARVSEVNNIENEDERDKQIELLNKDIEKAQGFSERTGRGGIKVLTGGLPASVFGPVPTMAAIQEPLVDRNVPVFGGEGQGSLNLKPLAGQARTHASASLEGLPGSPDLQRRIDQRKANLERVFASNRNEERVRQLTLQGRFTDGLNRVAASAGLGENLLENPNQVFVEAELATRENKAAKARVEKLKAENAELEARGKQLRQQQAAQQAATDTSPAVDAAAQQQETAAQKARRLRNEELEARRKLNREKRAEADTIADARRQATGGLNQEGRRRLFEEERADQRAKNQKKSDEARKTAAEERKARDLERANRLADLNSIEDPLERSARRRELDQERRARNNRRLTGSSIPGLSSLASSTDDLSGIASLGPTATSATTGAGAQKSREDRVVAQFRAQYNQAVLSRNFDVARRIAQRYFSSGDISPETQSIIKGQIEAGRRTLGVDKNVALYGKGGKVKGFSNGGDVPIMAQDGEFVMNRNAVGRLGVGALTRMNNGLPSFHDGGPVYRQFGGGVARRSGANRPQTSVVINGVDAAKELNNAIITGGETVKQSWQTLFDTVAEGLNSALGQISTIPNQINTTIAPVQIEGVGSFTDALAAQIVPKIVEQIAPLIGDNTNGGTTEQGAGV